MILLKGIEYLYFIVLPVIGSLVLIAALLTAIRIWRKKRFVKTRRKENFQLVDALGGKENILQATATGSRLSLTLKDYDAVQEGKLKELGVSSIIRMSQKITLVIGEDAEKICALIVEDQ